MERARVDALFLILTLIFVLLHFAKIQDNELCKAEQLLQQHGTAALTANSLDCTAPTWHKALHAFTSPGRTARGFLNLPDVERWLLLAALAALAWLGTILLAPHLYLTRVHVRHALATVMRLAILVTSIVAHYTHPELFLASFFTYYLPIDMVLLFWQCTVVQLPFDAQLLNSIMALALQLLACVLLYASAAAPPKGVALLRIVLLSLAGFAATTWLTYSRGVAQQRQREKGKLRGGNANLAMSSIPISDSSYSTGASANGSMSAPVSAATTGRKAVIVLPLAEQSLAAARQLINARDRLYQGCQRASIYIKIKNFEPSDLPKDVVTRVSSSMSHQGYSLMNAAVRTGCIELVLELVSSGVAEHDASSTNSSALGIAVLKALGLGWANQDCEGVRVVVNGRAVPLEWREGAWCTLPGTQPEVAPPLAPLLHSIRPLCFVAGSKALQLTAHGTGLMHASCELIAVQQGQFLQVSPSFTRPGNPAPKGSDAAGCSSSTATGIVPSSVAGSAMPFSLANAALTTCSTAHHDSLPGSPQAVYCDAICSASTGCSNQEAGCWEQAMSCSVSLHVGGLQGSCGPVRVAAFVDGLLRGGHCVLLAPDAAVTAEVTELEPQLDEALQKGDLAAVAALEALVAELGMFFMYCELMLHGMEASSAAASATGASVPGSYGNTRDLSSELCKLAQGDHHGTTPMIIRLAARLLAVAVSRGWRAVLGHVVSRLQHLGLDLAAVATEVASSHEGLTLLHLAVVAALRHSSLEIIDDVALLGQLVGPSDMWRASPPTCHLTPLHLLASCPNNSTLAKDILLRHAGAQAAWKDMSDAGGCTLMTTTCAAANGWSGTAVHRQRVMKAVWTICRCLGRQFPMLRSCFRGFPDAAMEKRFQVSLGRSSCPVAHTMSLTYLGIATSSCLISVYLNNVGGGLSALLWAAGYVVPALQLALAPAAYERRHHHTWFWATLGRIAFKALVGTAVCPQALLQLVLDVPACVATYVLLNPLGGLHPAILRTLLLQTLRLGIICALQWSARRAFILREARSEKAS